MIQFLDILDGEGWVFGETLYGEDFARMVCDLPEIRHIMDVLIYRIVGEDPCSVSDLESDSGVDELSLLGVGGS